MNKYEDKIELMHYLNVLWKRKWLIIIATILLTSVIAVISFLLPPKWEVDALFESSKYLISSEGGVFRYNYFHTPQEITNHANLGGYNNWIATNLSINIRDLPKLNAEKLTNTNLVRFSIEERDVEKAKLILNSLLKYLKISHDQMADFERKKMDSQITSKENEKSIKEKEINISKNILNVIMQKKQEIEKEMRDIRKKIEKLEKEMHLILKKKNISELEKISIIQYLNEIQQNSINHNILNTLHENKNIEEEIIHLKIMDFEREIDSVESEINEIIERKNGIYSTKIIKEPTSSSSPLSPDKLFNILIAVPLGLIIFTMLAFFLEYLEKQNLKAKKKI